MDVHRLIWSGALVFVLAGCSGLPDLNTARQAREQGDLSLARVQLEALNDFGVPEAGFELASLYAASDDSGLREKAAQLYLLSVETHESRAWGRMGRLMLASQPTPEGRQQARVYFQRGLDAGDSASRQGLVDLHLDYPGEFSLEAVRPFIDAMRTDAEVAGDVALARWYLLSEGLPAERESIESLCLPLLDAQFDCVRVMLQVYRLADDRPALEALVLRSVDGYVQSLWTPEDLYRWATDLMVAGAVRTQPELAERLLVTVEKDFPSASVAHARLLMQFPQLARPGQVVELLMRARAAGDVSASTLLARLYERGQIVPADPHQAVKYASEALGHDPSAAFLLGRIYRDGYLGESDPTLARNYLLQAARQGYAQADLALAEMFWRGRGVRVNPVYAWSFATLARDAGVERAGELLALMAPLSTSGIQDQGVAMAQQELASRSLPAQPSSAVAQKGHVTMTGMESSE